MGIYQTGMTDLDLQKALKKELEKMIKDGDVKVPPCEELGQEEWQPINVYRQEKPWKNDECSDEQENYILIMIDDEDQNSDDQWVVTIHFLFSIYYEDIKHQGNLVLADLMNRVYMHLAKKRIIDGKYELERGKAHKRFNQECYPNFYECDLITQWKLPEVMTEGIRDLV
jgi:hypothetical protein